MINKKVFNQKLQELKSPLSEIREGAYSYFKEIIFDKQELNLREKKDLLKILLSKDFLFYGIDQGKTNKTCVRSFTLLVINLILASDSSFKLNLAPVYVCLNNYLSQENDFRSYSEENGWIHVAAHFSDLLMTICWHKNRDDLRSVKLASLLWQKFSIYKDIGHSEADRNRINEVLVPLLCRYPENNPLKNTKSAN